MAAPSRSRFEEIRALRAGKSLAAHRVVELRSRAMHAIRTEFVVRLLRAHHSVDTLSVYWEHARRLLCGRGGRVAGEFPDLWLLCYPEDEEIRALVERELERMVAAAMGLQRHE